MGSGSSLPACRQTGVSKEAKKPAKIFIFLLRARAKFFQLKKE